LQRNTPATIHSEGWVSDWVDRAFDMDFEAVEALMVCLLGLTIKITGGNVLCHIPGLAFLAGSGGGGTKVERRREGLQYLALIQVIAGVLGQKWGLPEMMNAIDNMIAEY